LSQEALHQRFRSLERVGAFVGPGGFEAGVFGFSVFAPWAEKPGVVGLRVFEPVVSEPLVFKAFGVEPAVWGARGHQFLSEEVLRQEFLSRE